MESIVCSSRGFTQGVTILSQSGQKALHSQTFHCVQYLTEKGGIGDLVMYDGVRWTGGRDGWGL